MSRYDSQAVIRANITYDRTTRTVRVQLADGTTSVHSEAAERLRTAVAGLEVAQAAAVRSLVVAECAMGNVARQHGLGWNVRSITQP